jgi:hypothetical protein
MNTPQNKTAKKKGKPFGKYNALMLRAFGYTEKDVRKEKK